MPSVRSVAFLLLSLLLAPGGSALAEREVHVVTVGKGRQPDDFYALPEARVVVDRPGREVGLVLLDGGQIHWLVEATAGTLVGEIVRGGPRAASSRVSFDGIPITGEQVSDLPLVFNPWGRDFRILVDALTDMFGTERLHSLQGTHHFLGSPLRVDHVDTATVALARDYLVQLVDASEDLPPEIRNWRDESGGGNGTTLDFDRGGISLTEPSGLRRFPVTPDIPDILLPVAAVYDPGSRMIYCSTYGGEGFLYSVDVMTGRWAVVASLEEYDTAGLLYDPETRQLITTGAFSRPGEIKLFGLDGSRSSIFIPTTAFPGLTDLFDYGNEHGPPLTPRAFRDGWLLVEAIAGHDGTDPDAGKFRRYAVRIATGEVRLLRFRDD